LDLNFGKFLNFIFSLYKGDTNIGNDGLKSICKGMKSNPGALEQIKINLGNILCYPNYYQLLDWCKKIDNNGFFIAV